MTHVIDKKHQLAETLTAWKKQRQTIALIATMGALHAGHQALMQTARQHADRTLVTIFVNPTQFGHHEDFQHYPKTIDADIALAKKNGIDKVFIPNMETIYPADFATQIVMPQFSSLLCGRSRPQHFSGVLTVVARLFMLTQPDYAVFGEKDYQQFRLIERMALDINDAITIIPVATVREADGLACSSRNRYLNDRQRQQAAQLYHRLCDAREAIKKTPQDSESILTQTRLHLRQGGFHAVDYVELCNQQTLLALEQPANAAALSQARLFAAAHIGTARLIDNIPLFDKN